VADSEPRAQLRLQSIGWALAAGLVAGLPDLLATVLGSGLTPVLEPALRSAGCGFFYGLLAFHLQRVDPDDSHLQAGLVGAVCGIRSLGAPLGLAAALPTGLLDLPTGLMGLSTVMMELIRGWLPLWLPLIGSALVLHSAQRLVPGLRPARRP
jgi:hypothetical protein